MNTIEGRSRTGVSKVNWSRSEVPASALVTAIASTCHHVAVRGECVASYLLTQQLSVAALRVRAGIASRGCMARTEPLRVFFAMLRAFALRAVPPFFFLRA